MSDFLNKILKIKSSKPYIDYYKYHQGNIFGITKVSRWELVHSNFIAWALNPTSIHALGFFPLYQLIRCLGEIQENSDNKLARKISATLIYQFYDDSFITDANILREYKNIDLLLLIETKAGKLPIVIENKVESGENGKFKNQTQVYFDLAEQEFADRSIYLEPIYIFLFPEYNSTQQTAKEYIRMTYQNLVDYILDPSMAKCSDSVSIENYRSYLQCLSFQSDNEKGEHTMAISREEKTILADFLAKNKDLLCAVIDELDIDPAVKSAVKTGIKYQYVFDGNTYGVGPLVLAVVKKYVADHPGVDFLALQSVFPDSLVSKTYGVVKPLKLIPANHRTTPKRYFDDIIKLDSGDEILVCNQWTKEKIPNFIDAVKHIYTITQI